MMARTRRYELALMRDSRNVKRAGASHERIMAALEAGDLHRACAALRDNLTEGKAPVIAWLKAREAAAGAKQAA
jgi:DNA-binding GntR family transcriptional regulator